MKKSGTVALNSGPSGDFQPVRSFERVDATTFKQQVESVYEPAVLRQLVGDWPAVAAARRSPHELAGYLGARDNGAPVHAFLGHEGIEGRYFYRPDVEGFNFTPAETTLSNLLKTLQDPAEANRSIYMGSTATARILPGFGSENPLRIATDRGGEPRIWIGNRSRVAPHYDESDNIACVVSGRRRFILEDWSHWLLNDRAAAVPAERMAEPAPYTVARAREAGWQWRIPLQHRTGNGYVFSSEYISDDQAASQLVASLEGTNLADPKVLRFKAGRRKKSWVKNCMALGLSSGFLEPLESTSIHLIQIAVVKFLDYFPFRRPDQILIDRFNEEMSFQYETIRDFIIAHYKVTEREDTPYWAYCKNMSIPDSLTDKIELFRTRGEVKPKSADLFSEVSWLAVLYGQGIVPEGYHPIADSIPEDDLELTLARIRSAIKQRLSQLPSHKDYIASCCAARTPASTAA